MATQEQIIIDLQKRIAALEQRANNQSVRMSTIDEHIANLEKDMKTPKLLIGNVAAPAAFEAAASFTSMQEKKTS